MKRVHTSLRYTAAVVCFLLYIAGYIFYCDTIITWWYPIAAAMVPAIITAKQFYGKWSIMTGSDNRIFNIICHLYVVGAVLYSSLLGANYLFADSTTEHKVQATVISKYKKTHKKYRTVGRRRTISNGTYDSYHICLGFADGTKKSMSVQLNTYNKTRTGGTKTLNLQKGFLGFTVIKKH